MEKLIKVSDDNDVSKEAGGENTLFLREAIQHAKAAFQTDEKHQLIQSDWTPTNWDQIKSAYVANNFCQAASAAFSKVSKLRKSDVTVQLRKLTAESMKLVKAIDTTSTFCSMKDALEWETSVRDLIAEMKVILSTEGGGDSFVTVIQKLDLCSAKLTICLKSMKGAATSSSSSSSSSSPSSSAAVQYHPLAPKHLDTYKNCTRFVDEETKRSSFWSLRANSLQNEILDGYNSKKLDKEQTSELADTKEKLSGKDVEISLLARKVDKFENLLASSSNNKSSDNDQLKKENETLNEALENLQITVEDYETELKTLKSGSGTSTPAKGTSTPTRKKGGSNSREGNKSVSGGNRNNVNGSDDSNLSVSNSSLVVLRPMLRAAQLDAASWKAKATMNDLSLLKPLPPMAKSFKSLVHSHVPQPQDGSVSGEKSEWDNLCEADLTKTVKEELQLAAKQMRLSKARASIIRLGDKKKNNSSSNNRSLKRMTVAKLENAIEHSKAVLSNGGGVQSLKEPKVVAGSKGDDFLAAKVTLSGGCLREGGRVNRIFLGSTELSRCIAASVQSMTFYE